MDLVGSLDLSHGNSGWDGRRGGTEIYPCWRARSRSAGRALLWGGPDNYLHRSLRQGARRRSCARKEPSLTPESTRTRPPRLEGTLIPRESEIPHSDLVWRSINAIRALAMDAVEKAQSGHPGTPMALAPAGYVLWTEFLSHHPRNPSWADRDRFVLSCGHASMLLYSLLYLTGYDLSLDDLKAFRQWGSRTPGHPERGHTPGVETTTGPLGQGFGNAVGMAIAERLLAARYNRPGFDIVDHFTYGIVSDG